VKKTIAAVAVASVLAVTTLSGCGNANPQTVTCTVNDKDRSTGSKGGSVYRIYTDECDTLGVADNWLQGNFNSADLYAKIKVGERYEFDTVGYRNGFMSWFPEITKVRPAK
jgi:hypothetical protein